MKNNMSLRRGHDKIIRVKVDGGKELKPVAKELSAVETRRAWGMKVEKGHERIRKEGFVDWSITDNEKGVRMVS